MARLGIDIGTATIKAVAVPPTGRPEPHQVVTLPAIASFADGKLAVGGPVMMMAGVVDDVVVPGVKRLLGRSAGDPLVKRAGERGGFGARPLGEVDLELYEPAAEAGAFGMSVFAATAELLRECCEAVTGSRRGHEAVVAVPSWFDALHREAFLAAARQAQLRVLRFIRDTVATALWVSESREVTGRLAIVDVGAGGISASLVRRLPTRLVHEASFASADHGGDDIDAELARTAFEGGDRQARELVRQACEGLKRSLSEAETAQRKVDLPGRSPVEIAVERWEMDLFVGPLAKRVGTLIERLLTETQVDPARLGGVIAVGGSAALGPVKKQIQSLLDTPLDDVSPSHTVALGAALRALADAGRGEVLELQDGEEAIADHVPAPTAAPVPRRTSPSLVTRQVTTRRKEVSRHRPEVTRRRRSPSRAPGRSGAPRPSAPPFADDPASRTEPSPASDGEPRAISEPARSSTPARASEAPPPEGAEPARSEPPPPEAPPTPPPEAPGASPSSADAATPPPADTATTPPGAATEPPPAADKTVDATATEPPPAEPPTSPPSAPTPPQAVLVTTKTPPSSRKYPARDGQSKYPAIDRPRKASTTTPAAAPAARKVTPIPDSAPDSRSHAMAAAMRRHTAIGMRAASQPPPSEGVIRIRAPSANTPASAPGRRMTMPAAAMPREGRLTAPKSASDLLTLAVARPLLPDELDPIAPVVLLRRLLGRRSVSGTLELRRDEERFEVAIEGGSAWLDVGERNHLMDMLEAGEGRWKLRDDRGEAEHRELHPLPRLALELLRKRLRSHPADELAAALGERADHVPVIREDRVSIPAKLGLGPREKRFIEGELDGRRSARAMSTDSALGPSTCFQLLALLELFDTLTWTGPTPRDDEQR